MSVWVLMGYTPPRDNAPLLPSQQQQPVQKKRKKPAHHAGARWLYLPQFNFRSWKWRVRVYMWQPKSVLWIWKITVAWSSELTNHKKEWISTATCQWSREPRRPCPRRRRGRQPHPRSIRQHPCSGHTDRTGTGTIGGSPSSTLAMPSSAHQKSSSTLFRSCLSSCRSNSRVCNRATLLRFSSKRVCNRPALLRFSSNSKRKRLPSVTKWRFALWPLFSSLSAWHSSPVSSF